MRNLSVMEQKQVVGGGYYYKIFNTWTGDFMYKSQYYFDDELQECIDDCQHKLENEYSWDYCGVIYDNNTGRIVYRW